MSPKELLYIDDALGHTQFLMTQCREAANRLTDPALRRQAMELVNANQKLFTQFYNLVYGGQSMNDKEIMEGILLTTKGVCDLYMHGSIESATPNVHEAFNTALNDSLCMQDGIYKQMASRGWYPSEQVPQQQLQQVKQKYSAMG